MESQQIIKLPLTTQIGRFADAVLGGDLGSIGQLNSRLSQQHLKPASELAVCTSSTLFPHFGPIYYQINHRCPPEESSCLV